MAADLPAPLPFLTDRDDPQLAPYHDLVAQFRAMDGKVLDMRIAPEVVRGGDVGMVHSIILAAQHHPDVLERLLLGIRFQFEHPHPNLPDELADAATWKSDPTVQRWLARINELLPWSVYFAQDYDARFHMLFGDILNRDRDALEIKSIKDGSENLIGMTGEQAQAFFSRIVQASILLLHFCRPAGVDPQPAIEALLAELDIEERTGWDYERIYATFEEEVAQGFEMRASPVSDDELTDMAPWTGPEPSDDDDDDRF